MSIRIASAFRWLSVALSLFAASAARADSPASTMNEPAADKVRVYVGTYTQRGSKGIYLFDMDTESGKLEPRGLVAETASPSFLAIHPSRKFLYAVGEVADFGGKPAGSVNAFAIDAASGKLMALNAESAGGTGPCHLVVDKAGKNVLVANYGGGSAAVLPIGPDGRLGRASSFVQHTGSSVDKGRQDAPHAHSINLDPANRFAFVADLGLDKVLVYRFDPAAGTIKPNEPPAASVDPGAGPRHFAFHPSGKFAYVINEMALTVTAFRYDADKGVLSSVQTISTLPKDAKGSDFSTAEVQVHPSGKFLYGSNRGHHSIAAFRIDQDSGKLTPVGHATEGIKTPRNFGIDPSGKFLLVANQDGDSIAVYRIDPESGALKSTGIVAEVPMPVCVKFVPVGR